MRYWFRIGAVVLFVGLAFQPIPTEERKDRALTPCPNQRAINGRITWDGCARSW
jgi:hypothetical protein